LCYISGLYEVIPGIYQIRGFDISNMTIVQSSSGVIIIDPLISAECAKAGYDLYCEYSNTAFPGKPTKTMAVIYTHSHADHYGGIEGVLPLGPDGSTVTADGVEIIAPDGFMEHAVSENVYARNAMTRRATYMYGDRIPKGKEYQIGTGLGMTSSAGSSSLYKPTVTITEAPTQSYPVDGVDIVFQLTPGTEAPSEMNFHFTTLNALCMAENATHTMHNIQTLRGALVRDSHIWSKYMDDSIQLFGGITTVAFASHHWPTWGADEVRSLMVSQRDMYAYLNDQTLRMLNEGMTGLEIAEDFKLPTTLSSQWYNQGYYGSISHNVKAIYHRYMGWFDGNPAHLWEQPPVESAKNYLFCMGGQHEVLQRADEFVAQGNLRFAATLLSHAVFASDPTDPTAAIALANVLKPLGYQTDCGPWRNFFLVGAFELENGIRGPALAPPNVASMLALDLDQLMDTMAIRLNGPETDPTEYFIIGFVVTDMDPDENSSIRLTLSNCALTNHYVEATPPATKGAIAGTDDLDLLCTLSHLSLVQLVMGTIKIIDSSITTTGDIRVWGTLKDYLTVPETDFAIVTPEKYVPPPK
jgi:alkyl sulfatase BDS1-like metallo-beta-lactamase superfamily hydrolase